MKIPGFTKTQPPQPALPRNEFPAERPAPNNLLMRTDAGEIELIRLPPGATTPRSMEMARPHSDKVDIHALGWPANNHFTGKLRGLKDAHTQTLKDLNEARMNGRKADVHGLEKAERHARRSIDVFKSRHAKELRTEADHRQNAAASESASGSGSPSREALLEQLHPRGPDHPRNRDAGLEFFGL